MTRWLTLLGIVVVGLAPAAAQEASLGAHDRRIEFPDVPGYLTLECDLHQHTVFSDGAVWPDIRVQEAVKDGLDAISLTEHLEYQPHRDDIPHPDRNRSYELALEYAKDHDLIVIHGSEITRSMPPGHANAIFLRDANPLLQEDALATFHEAHRQGAFIFWNHPMWTSQAPDGVAALSAMHKKLIADDLLNGIEVVNETMISEEALQIALDHDLTIMGTSDIHGLIDWDFDVPQGGHRPVTLVFARERTRDAIREALFEGRTVVWFRNDLIGRQEHVAPLLSASLRVSDASYQEDTTVVRVGIENSSDAAFVLMNTSDFSFHKRGDVVDLEPQQTTHLEVKTRAWQETFELRFRVLNAIIAPRTHPELVLAVRVH